MSIFGAMDAVIRATGWIIRCMDMEFMCGRMGEDMKVSMSGTKRKVQESIIGRMVRDSRGTG